nr:DsbA family protein [Alphaproteobacteria bacterium]
MKKLHIIVLFFLLTFTSFAVDSKLLYQIKDDIILGSPSAPITIIDYSSFSCPSCASFHNAVFKDLEEHYIDKGTVKLIFRNYPLRSIDLKAGAIPLCAPKDKFYTFVKVLFKTQKNWYSESSHQLETLENISRLGGLSGKKVQECFNNKKIEDKIVASRHSAQTELGINSTPTLIINGKIYKGAFERKK